MPIEDISGFRLYNTNSNQRAINKLDVTAANNLIWEGNRLKTRDGSSLFKNTAQANWGRTAKIKTFKKAADSFFYVVRIATNGRVFYIKSDNASYGTAAATWTEINSSASATPALAVGADKYDLFSFNNLLYFCDTTAKYFSWNGTDADLVAETDPPNLGTNKVKSLHDKNDRFTILDDGGYHHLSAINNGQDFTTLSGGGALTYGRVGGLKASTLVPFGDDLIITTEDTVTQRYQGYQLSGIQFFDPAVVGSDTSQFEVRKTSSTASIVGDSAQEITGDTIGLTTRGFISLSKAINARSTTERDFISFPIKEIISEINFEQSDKISSVVSDGRYYCAIPFGDDATEANMVLVYDFLRSSPGEDINRWTIWTFHGFQDIATLAVIKRQLYIADTEGAIYKFNDKASDSTDVDKDGLSVAINYNLKSAYIGGDSVGITKDFGNLAVVFTDLPTTTLSMDLYSIIEGELIAEDPLGEQIDPVEIEQLDIGFKYDVSGLFYDDFNYYDSGSDQRLVTFSNRGGRAESMGWSFSTNTTGVSWGIGSISSSFELEEEANKSGVNTDGV
jgi:hypothetical protein